MDTNFDKNEYREIMRERQFKIPSKIEYLTKYYGDFLTYNQITLLYSLAVSEVLITHNIEVISDLPWGKGLLLAKRKWIQLMDEALREVK